MGSHTTLLQITFARTPSPKDAFDRIDAEGVSSAAERGERGDKVQECDGNIDREEVQLLLADAGETMTHLRVSTLKHSVLAAAHRVPTGWR